MNALLRSTVTTLLLLLGSTAGASAPEAAAPADGLRHILAALCPPALVSQGCVLGEVERRQVTAAEADEAALRHRAATALYTQASALLEAAGQDAEASRARRRAEHAARLGDVAR